MPKTLLIIGDVNIQDDYWAMQGFASMGRGRVFREYQYEDGDYGVREVGRRSPQMTVLLVHAPGYRFDLGRQEDAALVAGENWLSKILPVIELDALEGPQTVSIGDVDFGEYLVERVDVKSSKEHLKGGQRGGLVSSIYEVTIALKGSDDAITVNG